MTAEEPHEDYHLATPEPAWRALGREINVAQLISFTLVIIGLGFPAVMGAGWWIIQRDAQHDKDTALLQMQMADMKIANAETKTQVASLTASVATVVANQAEAKIRGESIIALLQQQKSAQDEFRADLQRVTGRFKP